MRPTFPSKNNYKKPFQKEWPRKDRMDDEVRKDLRIKQIVLQLQGTMGTRTQVHQSKQRLRLTSFTPWH